MLSDKDYDADYSSEEEQYEMDWTDPEGEISPEADWLLNELPQEILRGIREAEWIKELALQEQSLKDKPSTPKLVDYTDSESEDDNESLDSNLASIALECKTNEPKVPEMKVSQMAEGTSGMEAQSRIVINHSQCDQRSRRS